MNEFLIELQAKLDEVNSKGLINSDIDKIQRQLNKLKVQAEIDPNTISNLVKQLESVINQKITISNINVDTSQAVKNAKRTGENIGKQIQFGISSVIQKGNFTTEFLFSENERNNVGKVAQEEFKKIANGIVTVKEQMKQTDSGTFLDSFVVNIKKANGEVESLTYRLKDILDTQGKSTGKSFQYVSGSINNNGVLKQLDAISAKADSLQIKLDKLKSNYTDLNASRPIKDSNNISALSTQYDKVVQAIESVRNADNSTFSSMVSNAQKEITALESMVTQFRNAENVATQMKSVDISSGITQAQERLGKLKTNSTGFNQMTQIIRELDIAITNVGDKSSLDAFINKLRVAETQLTRVKAEAKSMTQVNKIQFQLETGGYESKVESLISRTKQWTDETGNARVNTDALSKAFDNLKVASTALSTNNSAANQQALIAAEKELNTQVKTVTNSVRSMNAELAKDSTITSLHQRIQEFYDKNGAAHRQWGAQLKQMLAETSSGATLTNQKVREIESSFIQVGNAARQAGKLGKSWFQTLKEGMGSFSYWISSTFLVMKTIQSIKGGISSVKALDTALVDLKKTTTMTGSELEKFYYNSNKVAKQMGVSTEEIINQAAEFSRLGYSSKEAATEMAKYSSWFKTISPGMSIEQAGDTLTSIMKAFKYDVQDVEKIMSMINTVGNNFAVSNLDISEILTRSSSAMMEANNSLADTIALGTAATEITRDAASVGIYLPTNIVIC